MTVIAITNQKGGCGKTTTAINLAACLGRRAQRTLLIDMDPQGHASLGLGQRCQDTEGLYEVFMHEAELDEVIVPQVIANVDLVPATISLAAVEHLLSDSAHRDRQLALLLKPLRERYDFILLDCPPSLGLLSFNALRAASAVLIPVELSTFALDGLERLSETVDLLSSKYQLDIPQYIVVTQLDHRTRFTRLMLNDLLDRYADQVLSTRIHHTIRLREAAAQGKPVIEYLPGCQAAYDYQQLAEELLIETGKASWDTTLLPRPDTTTATVSAAPVKATTPGRRPVNTARPSRYKVVITAPDAATADMDIKLAGEFNDWIPDRGVETVRSDGRLHKIVHLQPGQYQYRLVIDGKWQQDPNNPLHIVNNFGEVNSLLQVSAANLEIQ
ncbi:MAG: AAA family ATPase [Gammaproteobacteria bacterium]|nr:AAA family ATPase [Gammaproteobacteria bacterium]